MYSAQYTKHIITEDLYIVTYLYGEKLYFYEVTVKPGALQASTHTTLLLWNDNIIVFIPCDI